MAAEKAREIGSLNVNVNVDCSDALAGLKAIQREAKKATQALRELEEVSVDLVRNRDGKIFENVPAVYCKDCDTIYVGKPNE